MADPIGGLSWSRDGGPSEKRAGKKCFSEIYFCILSGSDLKLAHGRANSACVYCLDEQSMTEMVHTHSDSPTFADALLFHLISLRTVSRSAVRPNSFRIMRIERLFPLHNFDITASTRMYVKHNDRSGSTLPENNRAIIFFPI